MVSRLGVVAIVTGVVCAVDFPDAVAQTTPTMKDGPTALYCSLNLAPPVPCTMKDSVDATLARAMQFKFGSNTAGKSQTGWWSGTLDDSPAMGYELNRGHTIYSATDLRNRFEWWYGDMRHGSY